MRRPPNRFTPPLLLLLACAPQRSVDDPSDSAPDPEPRDTAAEALAADDARVLALDSAALPQGADPCEAPMLVRVDYAVDGDTLYAYPQDTERFGTTPSRVKVRLIGLDTPEIEHDDPAECFGDEAWDFTRDALTGRLAWLTFDAECEDDYDRTLAYLHREADSAGFFNRALLRQGYATVLTVRPNNSFVSSFEQDEAAARADGIGLWSACPR